MKKASLGFLSLVFVVVVSGCAAEGDTGVTLAQTKSTAQLQRNTISGQISPEITASVTRVTDASEACGDDPTRKMRLWRSTALTELTPEAAGKVTLIQQTIAGTFVSKGWESTSVEVGAFTTLVTLTNSKSLAVIEITAVTNDDGIGMGANLFVDIAGPCVLTDGPGSAELKALGE